jgi:hypothetical protein
MLDARYLTLVKANGEPGGLYLREQFSRVGWFRMRENWKFWLAGSERFDGLIALCWRAAELGRGLTKRTS